MVEIRIGEGEVEVLTYEDFEERVQAGRIPDSARIRFEPVTGDRFVPAGELDLVRSLRGGETAAWRARFTRGGAPILTALLVGVQIRIWIYTHVRGSGTEFSYALLNWLPPAMEDGEMWRILGSGLLHTDFLHILLNMVWMAYTGWNIERALGRLNLATIFFLSVVSGGLLSMFLTPGTPSLGASGGVYGLVSASVVFGFVRQELLPERGRRLFGAALAPYLALMFWGGLQNANTDNWAHFGGLVCGGFLAFLLDPPELQRRARQNAWVQGVGFALSGAALVGLGAFGPWLYPLTDQQTARLEALPPAARARAPIAVPEALEELTWRVPAGWRPASNPAGDPSFRTPHEDRQRSFAVVQVDEAAPLTADALVAQWEEALRRGHAEARISELPAASWQDLPPERVRRRRVELDTSRGPVVLDFVGATRGVYGFYRVTEVERESEARLAPLFARVDATVRWTEPLTLQAARRDVHASPRSVKARADLARELARWGEPEQAHALWQGLVDERPDDPDRWIEWVRGSAWYPDRVPPGPIHARAIAELPVPSVIVAVAASLRESGDARTANGLLGLAWNRAPGDRDLRRALRKAGLPWTLDPESNLPTELVLRPDGTPRPPDEVRAWSEGPLDLEGAGRWADRVAADREALAQGLRSAVDAGTGPALLLRVRDGALAPEPGAQSALLRDLAALEGGRPPAWLPAAAATELADPDLRARLTQQVEALGPAASEPAAD